MATIGFKHTLANNIGGAKSTIGIKELSYKGGRWLVSTSSQYTYTPFLHLCRSFFICPSSTQWLK
jgi:hypothetical protein